MDELFKQLAADPWGRLVLRHAATYGVWNCFHAILVVARLTGALIVAPTIITGAGPLNIRIALIVVLSLVIAPTLSASRANENVLEQVSFDSSPEVRLPATVEDLICLAGAEVALGSMLGLGIMIVFSGLRLGGEWLDRHSGLGIGTAFNPEWSSGESACHSLVVRLGVVAFLLFEPLRGEFYLVHSLINLFRTIPVGTDLWSMSSSELMCGILQESMILGLRIAMPFIATMMLVDITLAFCSRGTPQSLSASYFLLRTGVALFILTLSTSSIPDSIAASITSIHDLF